MVSPIANLLRDTGKSKKSFQSETVGPLSLAGFGGTSVAPDLALYREFKDVVFDDVVFDK